ncbi:ABC transporter ATP-binding protein (plasmid) [Rhizobium leguminosarum]|uniref:ATP-binding component of ABC transporter n=1 Tax=Rhizobium johnstonii (strain DSM 114642 / LMG 32736 / 3841) TaxID=216596 RepID=Q1M934_RHIJ3|nr:MULTISPECIES: ABC transporter ATP-binding protein [Rhizobium]MBY5378271.1 ABC transporter ATP-binding protein [Rhizobium leguminosarum]NEI94714.1 ATP-binding cassette domain-containing protein [Rhizobium leguminosarum]NEJ79685.1 ATP-binding cassette domain-containing protein [Rhizobium leguminosarum]TBF66909.1 ABC transporter ATP-binding protein [Rhizobium leguminosarum]TBF86120.1 ABC transporter ATP-binding protein [Rhizobium leguminosarum]
MTGPVLEIIGVSKRFGDNLANDDISMTLAKGEVVALLGENGAGKTTLMSILFGHYMPDAGRILIEGTEVPQGKPRAAIRAGVGMVHQHFSLAPNLTVLENVMTGTERLWSWRSGTSAARKKLLTISERFGLKVDPDARLGDLSVGEQQRVEILKALYNDARILILDEPTAVLTNIEAERLFTTLREMARQGLSLIFISHKLDEVMAAADRIVVLRGGKMVAERKASDTSKAELAELMVGRRVTRPVRESSTPGAVALEAFDVTVRSGGVDRLKAISFRLHQGEILGIIGVSGNGQAALAHFLSGIVARSGGDLLLFGESVGNLGVSDVVDAGIGRIPEDRNEEGVIGEMAIWENVVLERIASPAFSRRGLVNRKAGMAFAREIIDGFDVRGGGPAIRTRLLSGGNMQKLILGRNLHRRPRILIAAQPARGLDEGAVAAVHARLLEARRQGTAVLLISEDLDEVIALADRIQAIVGGRLSPPVAAEDADARRLGLMMAGEWQQTSEAGHAI